MPVVCCMTVGIGARGREPERRVRGRRLVGGPGTVLDVEHEERRSLVLPSEGALALLTIIGIIDDQCVPVDRARRDRLERVLLEVLPGEAVELSIDDAAFLMDGMDLTEALSMGLPWFEQVVMTAAFVRDTLHEPWTDEEWLVHRDATNVRRP